MSQRKKASRGSRHVTASTTSSSQLTQGKTKEERLEIASELESQLSNVAKDKLLKKPIEDVTGIRTELCSHLCEVILSDPAYSVENDCIHRLWRGCFYPQITSLRSRLIKMKNRSKKKPGITVESIKRTEKCLSSFLHDATQLYSYLATRYEAKLKEKQSSSIVQNLHKLLIHLGDLHRYSNEVAKAESAYTKASIIAPGRGNPYNQLAVVSQLPQPQGLSKTCISLYWYCRSLLATYEPFETSRSNMIRLFDYNKQWLQNNASPEPPNELDVPKEKFAEQMRLYKSALSRYILAEFVHLHGRLFDSNDANEALMLSSYSIIKKFKKVLQEQTLGEALIMKMVVINVFSCSVPQKKPLSRSFALLFSAEIAEHIVSVLQKSKDRAGENDDEKGSPTTIKMLAPLLLFCEFYSSSKLISLPIDQDSFESFHKQALLSFWKSIANLATHLYTTTKNQPYSDDVMEGHILKEHDQLRGFSPFSSFIPHEPRPSFFKDRSDLNLEGFLSTDHTIEAMERYKLRLTGSPKNEMETQIRVERFLLFVKASSRTLSESKEKWNENFIRFNPEKDEYVYFDGISAHSSVEGILTPEETSQTKNVEDARMQTSEAEDDDEEDDVIVYNGIDTTNSDATFEYSHHVSNIPFEANTPSKDVELPKIYINTSTDVAHKPIMGENENENNGGEAKATDMDLSPTYPRENNEEEDKRGLDLNIPSDFNPAGNVVPPKTINPPPGFDFIPEKKEEVNNSSLHGSNSSFGVLEPNATQTNFTFQDLRNKEENTSDHIMLPSIVLDSIGVNQHSSLNLKEKTQPPPGFMKANSDLSGNVLRENIIGSGSSLFDPIGGSSLLFGSTETLNRSNGLNSCNDEILKGSQEDLRTLNPFVTPFNSFEMNSGGFHSNILNLTQNGGLEEKMIRTNDDDLSNLSKNKLGYPGLQNTPSSNSWNPFL